MAKQTTKGSRYSGGYYGGNALEQGPQVSMATAWVAGIKSVAAIGVEAGKLREQELDANTKFLEDEFQTYQDNLIKNEEFYINQAVEVGVTGPSTINTISDLARDKAKATLRSTTAATAAERSSARQESSDINTLITTSIPELKEAQEQINMNTVAWNNNEINGSGETSNLVETDLSRAYRISGGGKKGKKITYVNEETNTFMFKFTDEEGKEVWNGSIREFATGPPRAHDYNKSSIETLVGNSIIDKNGKVLVREIADRFLENMKDGDISLEDINFEDSLTKNQLALLKEIGIETRVKGDGKGNFIRTNSIDQKAFMEQVTLANKETVQTMLSSGTTKAGRNNLEATYRSMTAKLGKTFAGDASKDSYVDGEFKFSEENFEIAYNQVSTLGINGSMATFNKTIIKGQELKDFKKNSGSSSTNGENEYYNNVYNNTKNALTAALEDANIPYGEPGSKYTEEGAGATNNSFTALLKGGTLGSTEGSKILSTNINKDGILKVVTASGTMGKKKEEIIYDLKDPAKLDEIIDSHLKNTSGKGELSQKQEQKMRADLRNAFLTIFANEQKNYFGTINQRDERNNNNNDFNSKK